MSLIEMLLSVCCQNELFGGSKSDVLPWHLTATLALLCPKARTLTRDLQPSTLFGDQVREGWQPFLLFPGAGRRTVYSFGMNQLSCPASK